MLLLRFLLLQLLNAIRCAAVMFGYTSRLRRIVTPRNTLHSGGDDVWANGKGAMYSRRFVVVLMALLSLMQIVQGRSLLSSAFPSLATITCVDWLQPLFKWFGYRSPPSIRLKNEFYRWTARLIKYSVIGLALLMVSRRPDEWADSIEYHGPFFMKSVIAFCLFPDLEEIAFEVSQPLFVVMIGDGSMANWSSFFRLVPQFTRVMAVVAIPTLLQLRGYVSMRIWGDPESGRRGGRARRAVVDDHFPLASEAGNSPHEHNNPPPRKQAFAVLASTNPVGAVALFGTTLLGLVCILGVDVVLARRRSPRDEENYDVFPGETLSISQSFFGLTLTQWIGVGLLLASAALWRWRGYFFRRTETLMGPYYEWEASDRVQQVKSFRLLTAGCIVSMVCCFWRTKTSLGLPFALALGSFIAIHQRGDADAMRALAFVLNLGALFPRHRFRIDSDAILLNTGRLLMAFEYRPFSKIVCESAAVTGSTLILIRTAERGPLIVILFSVTASLFVALANQVSRYQSYRLMRLADESRRSLDHAVKQKLAGVSSAIEQVLERLKDGKRGLEVEGLLRAAYVSMRTNHDFCHLVNLEAANRDGRRGRRRNNGAAEVCGWKANAIVRDWKGRMERMGVEPVAPRFRLDSDSKNEENYELEMYLNWDLVYYFVFALLVDFAPFLERTVGGKGRVSLTVRCEVEENSFDPDTNAAEADLILRLGEGFSWRVSALRRREVAWLAATLEASVDEEEIRIPGKVKRVVSSAPSSPTSASPASVRAKMGSFSGMIDEIVARRHPSFGEVESKEEEVEDNDPSQLSEIGFSQPEIPRGRVFGVLDDVALIRTATLSFLAREFGADEQRSFACGATMEDVKERFFQLVKEREPDVLIVDYYLDVVDTEGEERDVLVSGAEVAKKCRELGYKGAILIHTANEAIKHELDYDEGVIDGFLSKSFNRVAYERAIGRALVSNRGV